MLLSGHVLHLSTGQSHSLRIPHRRGHPSLLPPLESVRKWGSLEGRKVVKDTREITNLKPYSLSDNGKRLQTFCPSTRSEGQLTDMCSQFKQLALSFVEARKDGSQLLLQLLPALRAALSRPVPDRMQVCHTHQLDCI